MGKLSATWMSGVLACLFAAQSARASGYCLMPVEATPNVKPQQADLYYQGILAACAELGVKVQERAKLKIILDERDLAAALGQASADRMYADSAKSLAATDVVLVGGICKVESDFILGLRRISVVDGTTKGFSMRRVRLTDRFAAEAKSQLAELLAAAQPLTDGDQTTDSRPSADVTTRQSPDLDLLMEQCRQAGAERFFPAMWERTVAMARQAASDPSINAACYFVGLLHLCARASNPPPDMVFVPGGYAGVATSAGRRELWVEPFFIDRCEVSVAQYARFATECKDAKVRLGPITRGQAAFDSPQLPVTGISSEAASAYAAWAGKELPTALQWLRSAGDGEYPCSPGEPARCNLAGDADGFACLAPASQPADDQSAAGVLGLTGNVREWTATWFDKDAYANAAKDSPQEPAKGTMKLVKGGGWRSQPMQAKTQAIDKYRPLEAMDDLGFRCVKPFFVNITASAK